MTKITQERLKELLYYDPNSGNFTWLIKRGRAKDRAGTLSVGRGLYKYLVIRIDRDLYLAHRLAWFYMTGAWPEEIDHVDLNGLNNKFENLRSCVHQQNLANRTKNRNNTTGFKGVFRRGAGFQAKIKVNYKGIVLGQFATPEEASAAYEMAAKKYFGEFARVA